MCDMSCDDWYKWTNGESDIFKATLDALEDVCCGDDEGEGGDEDHGEGEPGQHLRQAARVRVLHRLPQPGPGLRIQYSHSSA